MIALKCKECGHLNKATAERCEECGVHLKRRKREDGEPAYTGIPSRCAYPGCELPPGWTDSTRGGGEFFCRWHARETDEDTRREIAAWSRGYEPETPLRLMAQTQAAANAFMREQGLARREDETSRDFAARCSAYIKPLLAKPRKPGRWWAAQVMARIERGEQVPVIVRRIAEEALVGREATQRETEAA